MADVSVPSIATATPTSSDTVVGVQSGVVKRFNVQQLASAGSGQKVSAGTSDPASVNITAGHASNSIAGGDCNTISGGGQTGALNTIAGSAGYRVISGGYDNVITGAQASVIAGGAHHIINGSDGVTDHATIGGGSYNAVTGDGPYNTIGGGNSNTINGTNATIGGGRLNDITGGFDNATIAGGFDNTASNNHATVVGGYLSTASGDGSVAGGKSATASGAKSVAIGGELNVAAGLSSAIVAGESNTVSATSTNGQYVGILGGFQNSAGASASARFSGFLSGRQNTINSEYAAAVGGRECSVPAAREGSVVMGYGAVAPTAGAVTHASGYFAAAGDAQSSVIVARRQTTDATPTELRLNSTLGARIIIPQHTTWAFSILVVARRADADNESAAYRLEGCLDNNAGTTALVGAVTKTVLAEDTAAWDVDVLADNTNDALQILVTGESAKTINWVARLTIAEVTG